MILEPHPGADGIGGARPKPRAALASESSGKWTLTPDPSSPFSPDAAMAMWAFNANQALTCQVGVVHVLAQYALEQSRTLAQSSGDVPAGPLRDALARSAELQAQFARELAQAASRFGRSFGHAAFAFPPVTYGRH